MYNTTKRKMKRQKMNKEELLGEEKIPKTLLVMGIPSMIGMLVAALYNIVDAYWVGKLGTLATAAVSVVYPLSALGMMVGLLFGCGANSVIARLLGKKEFAEIKRYSSTAIYMGLGIISGLIVLMLLGIKPVLMLLGTLPTCYDMAKEYAVFFILGLFFNVFNMCMNNMIVAEGSSIISMVAMLLGGIINIVLDPVLIINFGMGVKGAALATLFSRCISTGIYLIYINSKNSILSMNPKDIIIDNTHIIEIVKIGLPIAMFQFINGISGSIVNKLAGKYGADAQAAIGIVNRIMFLEMNVLYGFFKGVSPVIGYNYGAGKMERVNQTTKTGILWSTSATALAGMILIIFRQNLIYIFNKESAQVMAISSFALIVYAISYVTYGYQIIIGNYFLAIGQAKRGGMLSIGKGILYIVVLFAMEASFGCSGLILAQICTDLVGTTITWLSFQNYRTGQIIRHGNCRRVI